jgi:prevent-host-death family protein
MEHVGIRDLNQNASAIVARAASGENIIITDRGRPVARLIPFHESVVAGLISAGQARPPKYSLNELSKPAPADNLDKSLSEILYTMRNEERY